MTNASEARDAHPLAGLDEVSPQGTEGANGSSEVDDATLESLDGGAGDRAADDAAGSVATADDHLPRGPSTTTGALPVCQTVLAHLMSLRSREGAMSASQEALAVFKSMALDAHSPAPCLTNGITALRLAARYAYHRRHSLWTTGAEQQPVPRCYEPRCASPYAPPLFLCLHRVFIACQQHIATFNEHSGHSYRYWLQLQEPLTVYDAVLGRLLDGLPSGGDGEGDDERSLPPETSSSATGVDGDIAAAPPATTRSPAHSTPTPPAPLPPDPLMEAALWREQYRARARLKQLRHADSLETPTCSALTQLDGGLAEDGSYRATVPDTDRLPGAWASQQGRVLNRRQRDVWRRERRVQMQLYAARPRDPIWMYSWRERHAIATQASRLYDDEYVTVGSSDHRLPNGPSAAAGMPASSAREEDVAARPHRSGMKARADSEPSTLTGASAVAPPESATVPLFAGLVGFWNLGNTCYMSSMLQVLIHVPPIRNFFLADLHAAFCRRRVDAMRTGRDATGECFNCALDALVCDAYRGAADGEASAVQWRSVCPRAELDAVDTASTRKSVPESDVATADTRAVTTTPRLNGDRGSGGETVASEGDSERDQAGAAAATAAAAAMRGSVADARLSRATGMRVLNGARGAGGERPSKRRGAATGTKRAWRGETAPDDEDMDGAEDASAGLAAAAAPRVSLPAPVLAPQRMLDLVWRHADALASYAQQDAHEYFLFAVNMIHAHWTRTVDEEERRRRQWIARLEQQQPQRQGAVNLALEPAASQIPLMCTCLAHRVFAGLLRSDVVCRQCGAVSATQQEFFDVSVDLGPPTAERDADTASVSSWSSVVTAAATPPSASHRLVDGLRRFTQPEALETVGYHTMCACTVDNGDEVSPIACAAKYKQMSLRQLPPVICFHLKRFEQSAAAHRAANKVDAEVEFPLESLDLGEFMTSTILRQRAMDRVRQARRPEVAENGGRGEEAPQEGSPNGAADAGAENAERPPHLSLDAEALFPAPADAAGDTEMPDAPPSLEPPHELYDLVAVVNHVGKIDRGHYTVHVRRGPAEDWYFCDDQHVCLDRAFTTGARVDPDTSIPSVRSREAYVLFYAARREQLWTRWSQT